MDEKSKAEFKEREIELKNRNDYSELCAGYCSLAEEILDENDLNWAKTLYLEATKYVEFGVEWWDDFDFKLLDTGLFDSKTEEILLDKWETNVKENRGNKGYVKKEQLYDDLLNYLETKTNQDGRISRIKLQRENSNTIHTLEGPFGTSRNGDGKVVYLFTNRLDLSAVDLVVSTYYHNYVKDEDGDIVRDWAEYNPSQLDTDIFGTIEDELSFNEVIDKIAGNESNVEKFKLFIQAEILDKNIPLIFINTEGKDISQLNHEDVDVVIEKFKSDLNIFIREYDHLADY